MRQEASPIKLLDAKKFAFSILVEGCSFSTIERIFLWNDIIPPSESTFYRAQNMILNVIREMFRENVGHHRNHMKTGSPICFEGSWSHRRGARECLVTFIDQNSKKIVDFEVFMKGKPEIELYYDGPSNGMEVEGIRRMIHRWMHDTKVTSYVHDKCSKTRKAIRDCGWNITEFIDPNHLRRSLKTSFKKWNKRKSLDGIKIRESRLRLVVSCSDVRD